MATLQSVTKDINFTQRDIELYLKRTTNKELQGFDLVVAFIELVDQLKRIQGDAQKLTVHMDHG